MPDLASAAERRRRLAAYINAGMADVDGWLTHDFAQFTRLLSDWQHARGVRGDVAEIGVHHGRYFIALALMRAPGEAAIAIDVFEAQHLNLDRSGHGDRHVFLAQLARHRGADAPPIVHGVDSLTLRGRDLTQPGLPVGARRGVRLFSVDGCHTARHTLNDLHVACDSLVPGGVVLLDDIYDPGWPGVQEGLHRFLLESPDWCVAAYHPRKALITRRADAAALQRFLEHDIADLVTRSKVVELHGARCLEVYFDDLHLAFDHALRRGRVLRGGFGSVAGHMVELLSGWWPDREPDGTWTTAREAEAVLRIPPDAMPPGATGATLVLEVMPFLHPGRLTRPIDIHTDFAPARSLQLTCTTPVEFSLDAAALGRPLRFRFTTVAPERPADVFPGHGDTRPLGCMLRALTLNFLVQAAAPA